VDRHPLNGYADQLPAGYGNPGADTCRGTRKKSSGRFTKILIRGDGPFIASQQLSRSLFESAVGFAPAWKETMAAKSRDAENPLLSTGRVNNELQEGLSARAGP